MGQIGTSKWRPIGFDAKEIWKTTADELGLAYEAGTIYESPVIYGRLYGFDVEVTCDNDRDEEGKKRPTTQYGVDYFSGAGQIIISRDNLLRRSAVAQRLRKINDVKIGNAKFDRAASIDTPSPEEALTFLTPIRQNAILDFFGTKQLRRAIVTESTIDFETYGVEKSALRLAGNLVGLARFASLMGNPRSAPKVVAAPSARGMGRENTLSSYFDSDNRAAPSIVDAAR